MTTQEQKDKKVRTAEATVTDVAGKLEKDEKRLANLEAEFAKTRTTLVNRIEALRPDLVAAQDHLTWVRTMPVSGKASGEVGAIETPAADAVDE